MFKFYFNKIYSYLNNNKINSYNNNLIKLIRSSILLLSLRTIKIIALLFLISPLLDNLLISSSYAELQEIKEDWLCNDFGGKNCLFEDVYGCGVPGGADWIKLDDRGCIDKDKIVDGNKCIITSSNNNSDSDNEEHKLPVIEIDNTVYILGKIHDVFNPNAVCVTRDKGKICTRKKNEKIQEGYVYTSYSPKVDKIYKEGDKVIGLVTEVKKIDIKNIQTSDDCITTCSTKRGEKSVYKDDKLVNEEQPSECDKKLGIDREGYEEFYCEQSKGSCKTKSEVTWSDDYNKQYLKRSCIIGNDDKDYIKYIGYDSNNFTYYKLDKDFNINDYINISSSEYIKKSEVIVFNKLEDNKARCLEYRNRLKYDHNVSEYIDEYKIKDFKYSTCGNYYAYAYYRDTYLSDEGYILSQVSGTNSLYKYIYKFSGKLEEFIKKYTTGCHGNENNKECGMPWFWALKDSRCLNKTESCFLPQKETCLFNRYSKLRYCSLNENSECKVCIKWGTDLTEHNLKDFRKATTECMEWKTIKWNDQEFVKLYNNIPNSWDDEKKRVKLEHINWRCINDSSGRCIGDYSNEWRLYWSYGITLKTDNKCKYERVCGDKYEDSRVKISGVGDVRYCLSKYYNNGWSYRTEILDSSKITKSINYSEVSGYLHGVIDNYYFVDVDCTSKPSEPTEEACKATGYTCLPKTFKCNLNKESRSISWYKPELSIRDIELQEIYDPNMVTY